MSAFVVQLEKAALLRDVGKLVWRAYPERASSASEAGESFLKPFVAEAEKVILAAASHPDRAKLAALSTTERVICSLVCEAAELAAGGGEHIEETLQGGAENLASIFNVFGDTSGEKTAFPVGNLRADEGRMMYPRPQRESSDSAAMYQRLVTSLEAAFRQKTILDMSPGELAHVLEGVMSYVPSNEAVDISLYDQAKLTAALAVSLYRYLEVQKAKDSLDDWGRENAAKLRQEPVYLLVTGDLSGIQRFLYTIPSKGALKSLRGRSFYLELLLEHMADEILERCGVSRSCLLYTGGGHFFLLLPNTETALAVLRQAEDRFNGWLLSVFGTKLYLALGWTPCSAIDLVLSRGGGTKVFREVSRRLAEKKLRRYTREQLHELFLPESDGNRAREGARECVICHRPTEDLRPYGADGESEACGVCRGLFDLGKAVLEADRFVVSTAPGGEMKLPYLEDKPLYLYGRREETRADSLPVHRIYLKNALPTGKAKATYLWLGDYSAREDEKVLEFETLAEYSGGARDVKAIRRLGVMRADVDGLGAAFIAGFTHSGGRYATLSRTAAFSRQLSLFFKRYINAICAGDLAGAEEPEVAPFSLFGREKSKKRFVHIVYSGGDDVFLVGAWDDIVEVAVDLRQRFRVFTNNKLTFSAGIGFFKDKCPVSEMARMTGVLEDKSKENPGKDSVTLFGLSSEVQKENKSKDGETEEQKEEKFSLQRYSWDSLVDDVCGKKLAFLRQHFCFAGEDDKKRLVIGKSGLYRLLGLLRAKGTINLARFAYVLARMEPLRREVDRQPIYNEVREQFYTWYKSDADRQALLTALMFLIYSLRDKEEK